MIDATDEVLKKIVLELRARGILTDVLEKAGVDPLYWMIAKENLSLFQIDTAGFEGSWEEVSDDI